MNILCGTHDDWKDGKENLKVDLEITGKVPRYLISFNQAFWNLGFFYIIYVGSNRFWSNIFMLEIDRNRRPTFGTLRILYTVYPISYTLYEMRKFESGKRWIVYMGNSATPSWNLFYLLSAVMCKYEKINLWPNL